MSLSDGGNRPKVSVHILPAEDINNGNEVTLTCLVSSTVKQDYYIAWSEDFKQQTSNFADGIDFPLQKTKDGYLTTSVYKATKEKWNGDYVFKCNVITAGSSDRIVTSGVSSANGNACECD